MMRIKVYLLSFFLALTLISCGGGGSAPPSNSDPEVTLDSISINGTSQNLKLNETFQLIAIGTFSDASSLNISNQVTWLSSDDSVMTVSNLGLITAVSAGTASISASLSGVSTNTTVTAIALVDVTISPAISTLAINSTQQFTATASYTGGSTENVTNSVSWSTDDSAIATITPSGNLTAVSAGTSQVTASFNSVSSNLSLTIPADLNSISLNSPAQNLKLNETFQLIATGIFSDTSSSDVSNQVIWLSSDANVMAVSNSGLMTAVSSGSASISAALNGVTTNISVTAITLDELNISPSSLTLAIDSTQQFVATGIYTDSSTEDLTSSANWVTDNSSATATITPLGVLTAVSAGTSQVTASFNSVSSTISVIVSAATLQKIDIVASSSLAAGVTEQLSAIGTFSDGSTQNITADLSWQSSAPSIASIDQTALLTTLQQGDVVISATKDTLTDEKTITVTPATLSNLSITPSVISLAKGSTKEVTIIAFYSDQSFIDVSNQVTWVSSDIAIATAQENTSIVDGLAVGSNVLTASFSGENATLNVNVSNATLNSLNILPESTSLSKGLNQSFTVTGVYSDGSVQNLTQQVTWISSDNSLGSISNAVSSKGIADALDIGVVTITASLEGINTSTTLTIKNSQLTNIEITPSNAQVANGVSVQALAMGSYTDGTQVDITQLVQWESSNIAIANASASVKGLFETLSSGQVLISANLDGVSALSQLTVSAATLQSININSSVQTLPKGAEVILSAIGVYSDSSTNDISHQVTWTSTDDNVLTVENLNNNQNIAGLAKASNVGTVTVRANFNSFLGEIALTVSDAVMTQLVISSVNTDININSNTQASAIATFSDTSTLDMTQQVNWLSSNSTIASVNQLQDNGGLVKGLTAGSFQLSASLNGIASNSLSINVISDPNAPRSMTFSLTPNVILNDDADNSQIQVTLIPESESGTIIDGTLVSFEITEGATTRTETATTINGVAMLNLTSTFDGLMTIQASFNSDVFAQAGMLSTPDFSSAIVTEGRSNAIFENNAILKDSVFLVLLRNISNRTFNIPAIFVNYGPDNLNLPDSPITDIQFTNGGLLAGGAYAAIGYSLDNDLSANILRIIYGFTDDSTGESFVSGRAFPF